MDSTYNTVQCEYGGASYPDNHRMSIKDWEHLLFQLKGIFNYDDVTVRIQGKRYYTEEAAKSAIDQEIIFMKLEHETMAPLIQQMSKMIIDDVIADEQRKYKLAMQEMFKPKEVNHD